MGKNMVQFIFWRWSLVVIKMASVAFTVECQPPPTCPCLFMYHTMHSQVNTGTQMFAQKWGFDLGF